jgi:hypothetical protein
MTQKNKAIFRNQRPKVTHVTKKESDISDLEGRSHPCRENVKAIFRSRKAGVTTAAKKKSDISVLETRGTSKEQSKEQFKGLLPG